LGFVCRLPHELLNAFSATLAEAIDADLVLVVFDIADDLWYSKLQIVENVLADLGVDKHNILYVANKIDVALEEYVSAGRELLGENLVMISATKNANVAELKQKIKNRLTNT
ncbi:MAG: GTPase HflX, partial [Clostridia bacterium]|nr:GTPase HflX [Clostridia bacterium]